MQINIVMPGNSPHPIGGYKVIYQYANYFISKGNSVTIYESKSNKVAKKRSSLLWDLYIEMNIFAMKFGFLKLHRPDWIKLNKKVNIQFKDYMENHSIQDGDVIIATGLQTAEFVTNLPNRCGRKFYFIQHYETFDGTKEEVDKSWRLPLTKIVIATWLTKIGDKLGVNTYLVKNFLNTNEFFLNNKIENRKPVVSMLYHKLPVKGSDVGIEVLKKVKEARSDCIIKIFGVSKRPKNLPTDFKYYENASIETLRNEIYNKSQIYLLPSRLEGWGLTATEAMCCGAALVSTRNGGIDDFGIDGETALLNQVDDINGLKDNILLLLNDSQLRIKIAKNGQKLVSSLTLDNSGKQLLDLLKNKV